MKYYAKQSINSPAYEYSESELRKLFEKGKTQGWLVRRTDELNWVPVEQVFRPGHFVRHTPVPSNASARLIPCSVCGRQISSHAPTCPQCGHPNQVEIQAALPSRVGCYSCSSPATTRCQSCGKLSCALHLQSIYVHHGRGGAYELRCENCHSSALNWGLFWLIFLLIAGVAVAFVIASAYRHQQEWRKKHFNETITGPRAIVATVNDFEENPKNTFKIF